MLIRVIFLYYSTFPPLTPIDGNDYRQKRHMVLGWERAEIIDFSSIKVLSEL